jgi:predicted PurR-regulated permease PerM
MISRLIRIVSLVICVIAVGWFVGFAVEQSGSASAHQQNELNSSAPASMRAQLERESSKPASAKPGGVRKAIDDAFSKLSSPFSGLTSNLSSQWTIHIVDTLLALLIYGFGLGYLARILRFSS